MGLFPQPGDFDYQIDGIVVERRYSDTYGQTVSEKDLSVILAELLNGSTVTLRGYMIYPAHFLAYVVAYAPVGIDLTATKERSMFYITIRRAVYVLR